MNEVMNVGELVCSIIGEVAAEKARGIPIGKETRLRADLALDSLGLVSLVFRLEDSLRIVLVDDPQIITRFETVADVLDAVTIRLQPKSVLS